MTLDKIIYLASLAGRLQTAFVVATGGAVTAMILTTITALMESYDELKRNFCIKQTKKFIALSIILSLICVFIPSKDEVLYMSITKGYTKETIYQMSK